LDRQRRAGDGSPLRTTDERSQMADSPVTLSEQAKEYHQRAAVILGSPDDVEMAEQFYRRGTEST